MKLGKDDIAPELRDAFKQPPRFLLTTGWIRRLVSALMKRARAPKVEGVDVSVLTEDAPGTRIFMPETRKGRGALLWIHGGGYIIGAAAIDDQFCARAARELGIPVVSAEYRLAPKHPYPAALDDCHSAWRWMQDNAATLGIDRERIAIGGLSAGGGLAAALVLRVHDEDGPDAAAQWLLVPMLDDRTATRRELDEVGHFVWDNQLNHLGWKSYLGREPGGEDVSAYTAPARRDSLEGLPPSWIGIGSIDLFFDEDAAYAERLKAAGCNVTVDILDGAPHAFETWGADVPMVQAFLKKGWDWLAAKLG